MKAYKNTYLLTDYDDDKIDAIITTNESDETIQNAIYEAKELYYEFDEQDNLPFGIYCEFDFVKYYLQEKYDLEIDERIGSSKSVYY